MDSPDSSRPTAQPMKPQICNLIRPTLSTRKMATMTPKTNSTSIMAEPLAPRMSLWMVSDSPCDFDSLPMTAPRIVGVKMPMP